MRAAAAAIVLLLAAPAAAQEMPRYDVEAHCRAVASFGGSYSASLDKTCFGMEQEAYDSLKPAWPGLPSAMRKHCESVAAFGGPGSYSLLETCVQMESESSGANKGRAFKF